LFSQLKFADKISEKEEKEESKDSSPLKSKF